MKQVINVGTTPNDGTGDKLPVAFGKANANFTELYAGKEDAIQIGTMSQYFRGDKTMATLNLAAVTGAQDAIDAKANKGGITASGLTTNSGVLVGRKSTGTGALEALDPLEVKTLLAIENVSNTSDANKPISTATQTALAAKQDSLPAGTNSQFLRGDKTFVAITKNDVGLNAVDNTSDGNKPVFQATVNGIVPAPGTTAYNAGDKFLASNGTWISATQASGAISTVNGKSGPSVTLTKSDIGLANVDNTSDVQKPVSTAQQNALDGKANTTHTHAIADVTGLNSALNGKEPTLAAATDSPATKYYRGDKTWQTLDKGAVGLDLVNNTSDVQKPISLLTQQALDLKLDAAAYALFVKFYMQGTSLSGRGDVVVNPFTIVPANSIAKTLVPASADTTYNVLKNGNQIGTVTFLTGAYTGTISIALANRSMMAGDILEVQQVAADTTLDKVAIVLHN